MGTLRFFEEVVSFKIRRTFGFADYIVFLPPYREAVFSAVRQVEKAGPEIRPRLADEY